MKHLMPIMKPLESEYEVEEMEDSEERETTAIELDEEVEEE